VIAPRSTAPTGPPGDGRTRPDPGSILVLNAGSSSLKFSLFDAHLLIPLVRGQIEALTTSPAFRAVDAGGTVLGEREWPAPLDHAAAAAFLLAWGRGDVPWGRRLAAAGHRVVHGGVKYDRPVRIDAPVLADLRALEPLAPLHQPHNLAAIDAVAALAPDLPQVACFDTAFHRTQPAPAQALAIPRAYTERGVRRYGFHGLSYEFIASVLPGVDPGAGAGRTIVAHLGNGASLCAMRAGRSVATTMGFTALDGLVMGTRCGALDPGVLLYLLRNEGLSPDAAQRLLYEESGLLGVSGISSDMRTLLASGDPRAREAVDLFVYRAAREIGSLVAALGGLDALVFTAGIGEHAAPVRSAIARTCAWLGVQLDEAANERGGPRISTGDSRVRAWVIHTDEELMIARHTARLLSAAAAPAGRA
jgi:acetate kinase